MSCFFDSRCSMHHLDVTATTVVVSSSTGSCWYLLTNMCVKPNGPFYGTTQVSRYQKIKPIRILLKQNTVSSSCISWAICKSAPHTRKLTVRQMVAGDGVRSSAGTIRSQDAGTSWSSMQQSKCMYYADLYAAADAASSQPRCMSGVMPSPSGRPMSAAGAATVGSSNLATLFATRPAREWSAHLQVYRRRPAYVTGMKHLISYFEGISASTAVRRADAASALLFLLTLLPSQKSYCPTTQHESLYANCCIQKAPPIFMCDDSGAIQRQSRSNQYFAERKHLKIRKSWRSILVTSSYRFRLQSSC